MPAEAQRSITAREYEATDAGAGLQAPNRAQGLRTYFEPDGVRVVDREDDARELARLRTVGVGRGEARPVSPGEVVANGARVEVRRADIVEWFENSPTGLEQGWTLSRRPDGDGALAIEVDLGGPLLTVEVDLVTIRAAGGRWLEYGGLSARDARGTALAVRMEAASADRVRIVVEDAEALYPITVDPTLTQPAFATLMGDQAGAAMGYTVAGAGDVNADGYDDVIVGAPLYDNGQTDEGAAFVYLGGPNGIASGGPSSASARLESNQANAEFGVSVAGAGDVNHDGYADVIVGAEFYDSGQTDEGAAFMFLGGPSGVANGNPSTAATTLQSNQAGATFGYSVATAGDVNDDGFSDVIVGAPAYDGGHTDEGGAFVFLGSASGIPSGDPTTANRILQSFRTNAGLGISVASAGDTNGDGYDDVIAGARLYVHQNQSEEGGAFVWLGGPAGVTGPTDAEIYGDQALAHLGISVAGAGDVNNDGFDDVVVGANSYDVTGVDQGLVVVFNGGPSGVTGGSQALADARLTTKQAGANLGISVAGAGDVNGDGYDDILAGAHLFDDGTFTFDAGVASLILGAPSGIPSGDMHSVEAARLRSGQGAARLGVSVAGLGDVNRDGYDDVAAGASFYDSGQSEEGAAFVYLGSSDGLNGYPLASATIQSNQAGAKLGMSVAGAGDVNDDGYDDVIVGAPYYDLGRVDEGAAFVFLGSPAGIGDGIPLTADAVLHAEQAGASLGWSVAGAGDVNGDGYDDVVVGAPEYAAGMRGEGAVFVFHGGPAGIPNGGPFNADAVLQSDRLDTEFGFSVAGAGDVNDDGYDDVILGMRDHTDGGAFVFHGSSTGIPSGVARNAAAVLQSNQASAGFGYQIAGAGDTNGDGYDDVIVGARGYDSGEGEEGAAFVFFGGPPGVGDHSETDADATIQADQTSAFLGSVAGAGDVNGDGYDDVIVGDEGPGEALIFLGGPTGVGDGSPANADTVLSADDTSFALGNSVAGVGDVNGDGYDDVATTARIGSDSVALVYLGGPGGVPSGTQRSAAATLVQRNEETVVTVAGAGDVDGDGFDDVVVGDWGYTNVQPSEGGAFVYNVQRPPAASSGSDTVGIYVPASGAWFLRNSNSAGGADVVFTYGAGGGGFVPLRGDWDGDGDDTPGLYVPATGAFFLRNSNSSGGADLVFTFGAGGAGYVPMVGDWNGDGTDTIGLYDPVTGVFFLRNANSSGGADLAFSYGPGNPAWKPLSGDWNGDGTDTVGLFEPVASNFFLKNSNAAGGADLVFGFGPPGSGWRPIAGDFDGDGDDTVGLYNAASGFFFLRNQNASGAADVVFGYGPSNVTPLVGDWDGH